MEGFFGSGICREGTSGKLFDAEYGLEHTNLDSFCGLKNTVQQNYLEVQYLNREQDFSKTIGICRL